MQKECTICGVIYEKKENCSLKKWSKSKYCSKQCYWEGRKGDEPWNKGTKGVMKSNSGSFKKGHKFGKRFKKGNQPWNTGLSVRLNPEGEFKKGENIGEDNLAWKGEDACYLTKHSWVKRHKGHPEECEHCSKIGESYSYKRKGKTIFRWNIDWANVDHKYKRNLDDYIGLCTKCHRRYDKEKFGGAST